MSAAVLLSADLLSEILVLAAGSDIAGKFALAQVSAHWRCVALDSPLLWTRLCVSSRGDCSRLPLVLERCGPTALLDIEVSGSTFRTTDIAPLERAMHTLESYAARIRVLITDAPSNALLNSQLDFPVLHTLRVRRMIRPVARSFAPEIRMKAPKLRVLELTEVEPVHLEDLLSEQLHVVSIVRCQGVGHSHLQAVLVRCVHVAQLTFRLADAGAEPDIHWDPHSLRHLQTLSLRMAAPELLKVMRHAVQADAVLSAVTASLPYGYSWEDFTHIFAALLLRVGPLTHFLLEGGDAVTLIDDAGHQRTMKLTGGLYPAARAWLRLSKSHLVHETIRKITLPLFLWLYLAEDLEEYPPIAACRLRLLIARGDVRLLEKNRERFGGRPPALREVSFPRLSRVEFGAINPHSPTRLPPPVIVRILQSFTCNWERKIDVDIEAHFNTDVHETRDLIERECRGRWQLVNRP